MARHAPSRRPHRPLLQEVGQTHERFRTDRPLPARARRAPRFRLPGRPVRGIPRGCTARRARVRARHARRHRRPDGRSDRHADRAAGRVPVHARAGFVQPRQCRGQRVARPRADARDLRADRNPPPALLHAPGARPRKAFFPGLQVGDHAAAQHRRDHPAQGRAHRNGRTARAGPHHDRRRRRRRQGDRRPDPHPAAAGAGLPDGFCCGRSFGRCSGPDRQGTPPRDPCRYRRSARRGAGQPRTPRRETRLPRGRCAHGERRAARGPPAVCRDARHGVQPVRLEVPRRVRPAALRRLRRGGTDQAVGTGHSRDPHRRHAEHRPDLPGRA